MSIKQPVYLPLVDLLENRLFRIPRYQRAYSWKYKQRSDMFKDIDELQNDPEAVHFMATVVGLCQKTVPIGTENIRTRRYQFIDVVDGQQRLTTLVLLLKTIEQKIASLLADEKWCQRLPEEEREQVEQERKDLATLLVKPADKTQVLLQTNHDSSLYFANYLKDGQLPPDSEEIKTLADKELLEAIRNCQTFVNRWKDNIFELLSIIKNQLYFIFHEITDEAAVYTVFEVLNNRGLYVSWLDRFKSKLMAVVFENDAGNRDEHIKQLHQIWGAIYEVVGLREGLDTEALRFAATLRGYPTRRPVSEEVAVNRLISEVGTDTAKTIEISNWVLEVTKALKRVHDEFSPSKDVVTKIIQVRILATAIFLRNFPEDTERELLNQWENTSFRIFGICRVFGSYRSTAHTERGNYLELAHQITNNHELSKDEIRQRIAKLGSSFSIPYYENMVNWDCYTIEWTDELRYLLYRYEQYLAESSGKRFSHAEWNSIWREAALNSIEHIHPQSKRRQIKINVHCIGNLLLLPPNINSGLRDKNPIEKTQAYRNTRLISAEAVAETIETDGWNDNEIVGRSYEIMEWVNKTFRD